MMIAKMFWIWQLEKILSNCPHITDIEIDHPGVASYHFQSDLYDYLRDDHAIITPTKYLDLMASTSRQHFNSLKLSGANLPSTQLNHILSTSFPNIQQVEWKPEESKIYYGDLYGDEREEHVMPTTAMNLDLAGIAHLQHFVFDFCDLDLLRRNYKYYFFYHQL